MILPLILLALLQAGDWWTTRTVLAQGGRELNPAIRWLMERLGVDAALAVKCALVLAIATATGPVVAWIGVAMYTVVVGWNAFQMRRNT